MAPKNPVGKLAETALSTLKDPKAAAGKVVDQAKGTVALGRLVADTAGAVVGKAAGEATGRLIGRKPQKASGVPSQSKARPTTTGPATTGPAPARPGDLRVVPEVNEPAHTGVEDSPKKHGDVLSTPKPATKKSAAKKAPAAKAPAKKAPAAKKPPAAKAQAKTATGKVTASPADVAEVVEAAVAEDPAKTGAQPAKSAAAAKTAAAKKAAPGDKLPPRKSQPKSAAEVASNEGEDVVTQAGTAAVSEGMNPSTGDTSLTQPETPPVADPSVTKAVVSEQEKLRKAAEQNPE